MRIELAPDIHLLQRLKDLGVSVLVGPFCRSMLHFLAIVEYFPFFSAVGEIFHFLI